MNNVIVGLTSLQRKLKQLSIRAAEASKASATVGYTQNYAVHVHEDLQAVHPVGQAKYLEQPAREQQPAIAAVVRKGMKGGLSLDDSLLLGGLRLQRESQPLVPVLTGALRASAFTCHTRDVEQVSAEAQRRGDAIRLAKQVSPTRAKANKKAAGIPKGRGKKK